MSRELARAFYLRLTAVTADSTNPVRTAVSDRIFALEAPISSELPLAVWTMNSASSSSFFGGSTQVQASIDLSLFGKAEAGVDALAGIEASAFALLHDQNITSGLSAFDRAYIRCETRGVPALEGEFLRVDSTFIIEGSDSSATS
tara:strand:- start:98 stop:532 length:435 start_codon:yes stop_codon:yes gene_type:complete